MKHYRKTHVQFLKTVLIGLKYDFKAVKNTIEHNITNSITEGLVNKLKAVKRVIYEIADIALLKRKMVMEHLYFI